MKNRKSKMTKYSKEIETLSKVSPETKPQRFTHEFYQNFKNKIMFFSNSPKELRKRETHFKNQALVSYQKQTRTTHKNIIGQYN